MAPKKVILQAVRRSMALGILALLLSAASNVRANLQFDVFLGYNDIVPDRSWFPITCELNNDGPPFNAFIEINSGGLNTTPALRAPIDLPTGTRKRVYLPVFSSGNQWDVRLVDESGKILGEQTLQRPFLPALRGFPVVAAIARNVSGLPVFPDVFTRQSQPTKFPCARLQTALFPDNPLTLEGMNFLYLNSSKALELTVPQVNALVAWVENGGHLVVGIEQITDVNSTPWLRNLLPCALTSTAETASGSTLKAWLQDAAPPPAVVEPARRHSFGPVQNGFNMPPARIQNLPGIIATLTSNGVTYRTNIQTGPRAVMRRNPPMWLVDTNGSVSQVTPTSLSNTLALRNLAMSQSRSDQEPKPAAPQHSTDFDNATLQVATAVVREGKILIGDTSAPLAIQAQRGRGLITALTFSPEREPFLSWEERPRFWTRLVGISQSMFEQGQSDYPAYMAGRSGSDALFGAMIDSKQVHKLPLGWLLALLAAYLVVIGPLDQYWLKKINRQMLTWITFPCYVLLFSGLIYWIGFHLRNGELEWNELNVVDVLDSSEGTVLRGQTYISIYSPVNAGYKLASGQPFATIRGEVAGNYQEGSHVSALQHGNTFQATATVPVWMSQLFVSDWMQRGPDPVSLSLERTNGGWIATVENHLDHSVAPVRVAVDGRIYDLGSLGPGQSSTNLLARDQGQTIDAFTQIYAQNFRTAVQQRQSNFGNNADALPDIGAASMAACFVSSLNQTGNEFEDYGAPAALDLTRFARNGYGILLAWDGDHSLTDHLDQFKASRTHRRSLLRVVAPLPPPNT